MDHLLIYPMFGMFSLTFVVFVALFRARSGAVARGEMKPNHYLTYSTEQQESPRTLALSRHFSNLFETPLLFYVVCLAIMVIQGTNLWLIGLAWLYVGSRCWHAFIHTGSNNLRWRIAAYFASWGSLICLWIGLLLQSGH